ncbi:mitochondrial branched-chain alpha-ketoacid dehydrogenase kinase-domain-containing protein [Lentinula edodes]|uniref:Protein-serine/threonine kinase n=1 Tax=Lentinula lateritia TaxID=40482 RepID=A0A9W9B2E0_9AGAR|nr:mitochondrial pyruvate dehydrogenase [Lentinula edodes]KAJ4495185.1 mitochondrial branched-chain alpha-ketoacid dehydrogenase kinase-domain-containing protein [Lentinula edodes]
MSHGFRITSALWDKIHHFASFPQTGVSLQQMVLFGQNPSQGTLLKASQFLSEELPVRLAHRAKELDELPHNLSAMPSIEKVKNWYAQSFEELIKFPPLPALSPEIRRSLFSPPSVANSNPEHQLPSSTPNPSLEHMLLVDDVANQNFPTSLDGSGFNKLKLRVPMERRYFAAPLSSNIDWPPEVRDYNKRFTRLLETIKTRHDPTVTTVAQGVLEWKRSQRARHIGLDMQQWLDRFYLSRIGIRFLIGQHIALNTQESHPDYVGIICTNANVHDIIEEAIENARFVCEEHYALFSSPPVQLICPQKLTFPYVPGHLSHIIFELLKNSLRAVVERHGVGSEGNFPPIKVIVVEGKEDITIKISDEGGGIARSAMGLIWTYMYTTMNLGPGEGLDEGFRDSDFKAPMAGFGYGLPLSRLYARYFGGDLRLISMDGFGTDVYIHLNRLSSSREPLP